MQSLLPRPVLMLVTEPGPRLADVVAKAVAGGVNVVQWRWKEPEAGYKAVGRALRQASAGAMIVTNGPPRLERAALARGVQIPEAGPSIPDARRVAGEGAAIGRSVHSVESARRAEAEGADYAVAGTIFASQSHPEVAPQGLDFLRAVCAAVAIPVIAISGVTPENAPDCLRAGAAGVAVLSPIMRAADPRAVAERYWRALTTNDTNEHE